jgi:hypothetical protein
MRVPQLWTHAAHTPFRPVHSAPLSSHDSPHPDPPLPPQKRIHVPTRRISCSFGCLCARVSASAIAIDRTAPLHGFPGLRVAAFTVAPFQLQCGTPPPVASTSEPLASPPIDTDWPPIDHPRGREGATQLQALRTLTPLLASNFFTSPIETCPTQQPTHQSKAAANASEQSSRPTHQSKAADQRIRGNSRPTHQSKAAANASEQSSRPTHQRKQQTNASEETAANASEQSSRPTHQRKQQTNASEEA